MHLFDTVEGLGDLREKNNLQANLEPFLYKNIKCVERLTQRLNKRKYTVFIKNHTMQRQQQRVQQKSNWIY